MRTLALGNVQLRPVGLLDAQLIFDLRSSPAAKRFLNPVRTLDEQRRWLGDYLRRASSGNEYYFIVENSHVAVGTIRICQIEREKKTFEWGSWIIREGEHPFVAISAVLLLYEFAFDELGLESAFFDVRSENHSVVRFHETYGANRVRGRPDSIRFELKRSVFVMASRRWRAMMGFPARKHAE